MAEVLFEQMSGQTARVWSAGIDPWPEPHPIAVKLMSERGLDVTNHRPRQVKTLAGNSFDIVVTIGDAARDGTPELPGNPRRIHWDISDPADADGASDPEPLFRRALARIEERLPDLLPLVDKHPRASELHLAPGISTLFLSPARFEPAEHLPLMAEAGFKCFELCCAMASNDFAYDREDKLDELLRVSNETGLQLYSLHAPISMFTLPGRSYARSRGAIDMLKHFADLASALGAQVVVIHARPDESRRLEEEDALIREALRELEEHILPLSCVYAWENGFTYHSAEEHLEWIRSHNPGAFGFAFDTGHAVVDGQYESYLPACSLRLCGLHLHDVVGGSDHKLPGTGVIDWGGFLTKLEAAGYVGPLMLEPLGPQEADDYRSFLSEAMASLSHILGSTGGRR